MQYTVPRHKVLGLLPSIRACRGKNEQISHPVILFIMVIIAKHGGIEYIVPVVLVLLLPFLAGKQTTNLCFISMECKATLM